MNVVQQELQVHEYEQIAQGVQEEWMEKPDERFHPLLDSLLQQ